MVSHILIVLSTFIASFNKSSNVYVSPNYLSINRDIILFLFFVDVDRARPYFKNCQLWLKTGEI